MAREKAPTTLHLTFEDIRLAAGTIKGAVIDTRFWEGGNMPGGYTSMLIVDG